MHGCVLLVFSWHHALWPLQGVAPTNALRALQCGVPAEGVPLYIFVKYVYIFIKNVCIFIKYLYFYKIHLYVIKYAYFCYMLIIFK